MRVIRFLITSLLIIGVVGSVGALLTREALLIWGVATVRDSVSRMRRVAANSGSYIQECHKKGVKLDSEIIIQSIQLRFSSPSAYDVEVVCAQVSLEPIIVETKSLPMFVEKVNGGSGLVWGDARSAVTIKVFGRTRTIVLAEQQLSYEQGVTPDLGVTPPTSCEGYGYQCCPEASTQGAGQLVTSATNCPRSCFASCQRRPVVLSFTSEPFYDPNTRQVSLRQGESLTFNYVVELAPRRTLSGELDFGDGNSVPITSTTGKFDHVYACNQAECQYLAAVKVQDDQGITAFVTPVTQLKIVVAGR